MTEIVTTDVELGIEERNLLSVAFKNLIGSKRVSWRVLHSIEQKEKTRQSEEKLAIVVEYKSKIENEMKKISENVFLLLDDHLIKNATSGESKVFFQKMLVFDKIGHSFAIFIWISITNRWFWIG